MSTLFTNALEKKNHPGRRQSLAKEQRFSSRYTGDNSQCGITEA